MPARGFEEGGGGGVGAGGGMKEGTIKIHENGGNRWGGTDIFKAVITSNIA